MRRTITALVTAGLAATSAAAFAQPSRLTDSQYLAAVRCEALMNSPSLGKVDASGLATMIRDQGVSRDPSLFDRADSVRDAATSQARHADATGRAALVAERSGACQAFATN